jgi:hypothetical protein
MVYVVAAIAAGVSVSILVYTMSTRIDKAATLERFVHPREPATASAWLRAGVRSLGKVPSLRLPTQDSRAIKVETVNVVDSVVWRETLQSTGDGLFVDMGRDSDADLVVNERHPYAKYMLDFDNLLLKLRSTGRRGVFAAFAEATPRRLEQYIFHSVENRPGLESRVYTLDSRFPRDKNAAQAAYDLLFAVTTLRACYVNGEIMDGILSALEDHATTKKNNAASLSRIRAKTLEDVGGAHTVLMGQLATEESRMAAELADTVANVSELEKAHAELARRSIVSRGTRQSLVDTASSNENAGAKMKSETVLAENVLDDVVVKRSGITAELDSAQIRAEALAASRDKANAASASQIATTQSDAARANAALGRNSAGLQSATRAKADAEQRARDLQEKRARAIAISDSSQVAIDDARSISDRVAADIAQAHDTALALSQQEAEIASNKTRTLQGTRLTKQQMDAKLALASKSSNNAQNSYALWDKYASLAKLADELDANDDGLPK